MGKPHAPAFSGPQINIDEASRGGINASTPADQRAKSRTDELSEGPKREKPLGGSAVYKPAKYEVVRVIEDSRGNPVEHKIIREDR
jgi:hypothetical protein